MTQSRRKGGYGRTLEKLHGSPPSAGHLEHEQAAEQESATEEIGVATPQPATTPSGHGVPAEPGWWRRPRTVQFNTSRIEFSVSYPVAIAILLGLILLFLLAFRIGQYRSFLSKKSAGDNSAAAISSEGIRLSPVEAPLQQAGAASSADLSAGSVADLSAGSMADDSPVETMAEPATPKGGLSDEASAKAGNVIVLVEYPKRADLVPVQKHFAQFGIGTEIVSWGGKYFLVTRDRYAGFGVESDGYEAKQKIVEVGAKYKAPQGYETFAPLFFRDAYGKKIE